MAHFSVPVTREVVSNALAAYLATCAGPESALKILAEALAAHSEIIKGREKPEASAHLVNVGATLLCIAADSRALITALYTEGK
jgi:hypothetical protein